ncbi:MAG TPA: hypothetical protein VG225_10230 [Terracidiphilus sp.]|jgi:hypothetical protein|nr:hypothetical protein [Terracidiphilus sp.]
MSSSVAKAKGFVIDRVLEQARQDGISLSELEVRMLGFAETTASAKDVEAAAAFERENDDEQYESTIADLLRKVYDRDVAASRKEEWDRSLDDLADEDLYLLVMLEKAGIVKTTTVLSLPDWRLLVGLIPVLAFVALALLVAFLPWAEKLIPNSFLRLGICVFLLAAPVLLNLLRSSRAGKL